MIFPPRHFSRFWFGILLTLVISLIAPQFVPLVLAQAAYSQTQAAEQILDEASGGALSIIRAVPKPAGPTEVPVADFNQRLLQAKTNYDRFLIYLDEWGQRVTWRNTDKTGARLFKSSLHYLFNTLAYDLAVWISSGATGQKPMFITQGWGPYLLDVADGASGYFLEYLGLVDWVEGFNVCEPDINLKISIGLGLAQQERPEKPDCTIKEAVENWDDFLADENFLDKFSFEFDPRFNDIMVALKIFDYRDEYVAWKKEEATKDREETEGFKAVVSKISKAILTPGQTVKSLIEGQAEQARNPDPEKVWTNDLWADAIDTFVQTLAYQLLQQITLGGLSSADDNDDDWWSEATADDDLFTGDSGAQLFSGTRAAQARYSRFLEAGIVTSGPFDILQKLATCNNLQNPMPDECVIDQDFQIAISRGLTVREALAAGYLDGNAAFGFRAKDIQPSYKEGYPYRNLLILRTHRIIPVTWEIAAEIINRGFDRLVGGSTGQEQHTYTLNELIAAYDNSSSPFYHLIDPDWVLKAAETFCKAEGYGPVLTSDRITAGSRTVARATYCADYQSCLEKDAEGNCIFGYCTEEKRIWNLSTETCPEVFNTCQTFQSRQGQIASYLQNTLAYNGCNSNNVGCQWFCQDYNTVNNLWTCLNSGETVLKTCNQPGGCPLSAQCDLPLNSATCLDEVNGVALTLSAACQPGSKFWEADSNRCAVAANCQIQQGGAACIQTGCEGLVNLLSNPSFEIGAASTLAQNWSGSPVYFERASGFTEQIFSGNYSLRFFASAGQLDEVASSSPILLPAGNYSFSSRIFNRLNRGDIEVSIIDANNPSNILPSRSFNQAFTQANLAKNRWQELSTTDFVLAGDTAVRVQIRIFDPTQVNGAVWLDDLRISQSCVVNDVLLTLPGTIEKDQSKIHFDRDVQTCDPQNDGCSQFFSALEGISYADTVKVNKLVDATTLQELTPAYAVNSYNLIPDAGFEDGLLETLWNISVPNTGVQVQAALDPQNARSGGKALKLTKVGTEQASISLILDTQKNLKGRTFIFSFWAKANVDQPQALTGNAIGPTGVDPNGLYTTVNMATSITDGRSLGSSWKQFAVPVNFNDLTTGQSRFSLVLSALADASQSIFYDDLQVEEIDLDRISHQILRGLDQDQCIGSGRSQRSFTIWANQTCYQLDLVSLLNRASVNIRQAPDYLGCRGYTAQRPSPYVLVGVDQAQCQAGTNLVWRPDGCHEIDPAQCANYAPYCQEDEVGCQAYTPLAGGADVPGVVGFDDFCPAQCVGYDAYKQSATAFETQESLEFFIPETARQCNVSQAGCDEFTNLDEVAAGGEGKGYFSYLRQCALPDDQLAGCSNFYSWQGSDETGFQLKVNNLSTDTLGAPKLAIAEAARQPESWGSCIGLADVKTNPFCREVFDSLGRAHYVILDNTITCSDNCQPFRKTRLGESEAVAQTNCEATNGRWDGGASACVYQAIPGEGLICSAQAAGCREYRGNTGGNVFIAWDDNFEDGETSGWLQGQISSEALSVAGHSIKTVADASGPNVTTLFANLTGGASCSPALGACSTADQVNCYDVSLSRCRAQSADDQGCLVKAGENSCSLINSRLSASKTYLLSFWAKSASQNIVPATTVDFVRDNFDSSTGIFNVATTTVGLDWKYYSFGPFVYDELNPTSRLRFQSGSAVDIYLDNIQIKEVFDYVYAIKNSWQTPEICDQNPFVDPVAEAPQFMLGCRQYKEAAVRTLNLKSFNHLCREEVVGCSALVDTHNSTSVYAQEFNPQDPIGLVLVPADSIAYVVNRPEFQCQAEQKGCQRLGAPILNQDRQVIDYNDVYLVNNPDQYSQALCGQPEVSCEEFRTEDGLSYFKTPGDRFCEYRQGSASSNVGWYRTGSSSLVPDCPLVRSPLGVVHANGATGWVGLCPAEFSGCSEFVDPVSDIATNKVFNPDFRQDVNTDEVPDGWNLNLSTTDVKFLRQNLHLKPGTVYTLSLAATRSLIDPDLDNVADFSVQIACPGVTSFDNSLQGVCVDAEGRMANRNNPSACLADSDCAVGSRCAWQLPPYVYQADIDLRQDFNLPPEREYSGRFYVSEDLRASDQCRLIVELDPSQVSASSLQDRAQKLLRQIAIRETGVYYNLKNSVDRRSCNGVVNFQEGCVLFNDRSAINYKLGETDTTYLSFDADVSGALNNNGLPVVECAGPCDSNAVLQVRPDRSCGQWLACKTKIKAFDESGQEKDYCLDLVACDAFDPAGNCANFVQPDSQLVNTYSDDQRPKLVNFTVEQTNQERLKNISGYARGGTTLSGLGAIEGQLFESQNTVDGFYPADLMTEIGGVAEVPNGNFESFDENRLPTGWELADPTILQENFRFRVVTAGTEAVKTEGISILGLASLKLNATNELISEPISVFPNTDYVLSAGINTTNLQPDTALAFVDVIDLNEGNSLLDQLGAGGRLSRPARSLPEWQSQTASFNSGNNSQIRIKLYNFNANPLDLGNASYFDNIELLPVLPIKDILRTAANLIDEPQWLTFAISRSCRIFPEQGSLSCRYQDGNGLERRGWSGYCLLADPNNSEVCLQWWPVDLIKGDLFGNYPGYQDRVPQYYCAVSKRDVLNEPIGNGAGDIGKNESFLESLAVPEEIAGQDWWRIEQVVCNWTFALDNGDDEAGSIVLDPTTGWQGAQASCNGAKVDPTAAREAVNGGSGCEALGDDVGCDEDRLIYCQVIIDENNIIQGFELGMCNPSTSDIDDEYTFNVFAQFVTLPYCSELVQVVTPTGQNKGWLSRISEGSQYVVNTLSYTFGTDYKPFGSIVYPAPANDPAKWDSKDDQTSTGFTGKQQLFVEAPDRVSFSAPYQARAGSPYSCVSAAGALTECLLPTGEPINLPEGAYTAETAQQLAAEAAVPRLQRLFAQSYGVWKWVEPTDPLGSQYLSRRCSEEAAFRGRRCIADSECYPAGSAVKVGACQALAAQYVKLDPLTLSRTNANSNDLTIAENLTWDVPTQLCAGNKRPTFFKPEACQQNPLSPACDYCAVAPLVSQMVINDKASGEVPISNPFGIGTVELKFNVTLDANQLPLRSYQIDWGDNIDSVSGASLRDRSDFNSPYRFAHAYSYYELLDQAESNRVWCTGEEAGSAPIKLCQNHDIYCRSELGNDDCAIIDDICGREVPPNTCVVQPRIQVVDNWGWCNGKVNQISGNPVSGSQWGYLTRRLCASNPDIICSANSDCPAGDSCQLDSCFTTVNAWTDYPGYIMVSVTD